MPARLASLLRSHGLLLEGTIVVVAAIVTVVLATGGGSGGSTAAAATIAHAANVTDGAAGYRMTIEIREQAGGRAITTRGSGAFAPPTHSGALTLTVRGRAVREVVAYPWVYERLPASLSGTFPTPWVEINIKAYLGPLGLQLPLESNPVPRPNYKSSKMQQLGALPPSAQPPLIERRAIDY